MSKRKSKKNSITHNHLELLEVQPITKNQQLFFENYDTGKSQVLLGHSGVGKTFLSMYKALEELQSPRSEQERIVVVRSAVPTRDLGFLPGTLEEKGEVYELPYKAICSDLFNRDDSYSILKKHKTIEFMTTSFIRGLTLDNAIIIVDEFQNMTAHEADSILTRAGTSSKVLFCGDMLQRDFIKNSEKNIEHFLNVLDTMPKEFDFTYFDKDDVVRSGLVGNYLKAKHNIYPNGYSE